MKQAWFIGLLLIAQGTAVRADPIPPHSCTADADVQQVTGAARTLFLARCEAGRTAPIAGTPNQPSNPHDPAEICRAKAIGDKITNESRENYIRDCVKKAGEH